MTDLKAAAERLREHNAAKCIADSPYSFLDNAERRAETLREILSLLTFEERT